MSFSGFGDVINSAQWRHQQDSTASSTRLGGLALWHCTMLLRAAHDMVWIKHRMTSLHKRGQTVSVTKSRWPAIRRGHCRSGHQRKMTRMAIMRATMTTQYPARGHTISRVPTMHERRTPTEGQSTELASRNGRHGTDWDTTERHDRGQHGGKWSGMAGQVTILQNYFVSVLSCCFGATMRMRP